jgi:hypothetical protein
MKLLHSFVFVCAGAMISGCSDQHATTFNQTKQPAAVGSALVSARSLAKVVKVDQARDFVVLHFTAKEMPPPGNRISLYRDNERVATIKVTEPMRPPLVTADILDGQVRMGDEVLTLSAPADACAQATVERGATQTSASSSIVASGQSRDLESKPGTGTRTVKAGVTEVEAWQKDCGAFVEVLADLAPKASGNNSSGYVDRFKSKEVVWKLTFKAINRDIRDKFPLTFDLEPFGIQQKKPFFSGKPVMMGFEPEVETAKMWKDIKPGSQVTISAVVLDVFFFVMSPHHPVASVDLGNVKVCHDDSIDSRMNR